MRAQSDRARRGVPPVLIPAAVAAAALFVIVVLLPSRPAAATTVVINGQQSLSLPQLQQAATKVQRQIARLDDQMEIVVEDYNAANARLDAAGAELATIRLTLARRQAELERQQEILSQRIVWMYKFGASSFIDGLLSSASLTDAESRVEFFSRLTQQDKQVRESFLALTAQVQQLEKAASAKRQQLLAIQQQVDSEKQVIEDKLAERQAILDGLDARIRTILARRAAAGEAMAARLGRQAGVDLGTITGTPAQIAVVREALKYLGVPYLWGGASPVTGFDCSGLVQYVYARFHVSLIHFAASQATQGTPVSLGELQPADLVFFGNPIHHVGIYAGNGLFIQAPHTGDVVKVTVLATYETPSACRRYSVRLP